ncbi:MAG: prepilin-type N-terminal cleavage/methylation domain-containing protein [Kiritimatiellia bacterium]
MRTLRRAFSLVELLAVVAIVLLLLALPSRSTTRRGAGAAGGLA